MSNLELFKGNPLVKGDLFKSLMETNKKLAGSGGGNRISLRGGRFRLVVGGEEVSVRKDDTLNVLVVNASTVQRTYFKEAYDPKAEKHALPHCWSTDSKKPSPDVPEKQRMSSACDTCKMNIKGSGQGDSRACRFSQRLAVMLEGDTETIYGLQVPAASIFGSSKGSDMGLQAYVKFLTAHETPVQAVLTELRFDDDSETPKLFFKPVRPLEEDELNAVVAAMDTETVKSTLTLSIRIEGEGEFVVEDADEDEDVPPPVVKSSSRRKVVEIDDEDEAPPPKKRRVVDEDEDEDEAPPPKKRRVVEVDDTDDEDDDEDEAPPPKKRTKTEAPVAGGRDLGALLDEWDD